MTFNDVLEIKNGRNQKAVENPDGRYPIYGSGGIIGHSDDYICEAGTVIVGRKGSINNPIFVGEPFWNVDTAFGLTAKKDVLLPRYLYYFCMHFDFERLNKAVTIPSLTKSDLLKIEILLPDLNEQQNVVDKLQEVERIMLLHQEAITKLDEIIKARFVEMFGDPGCNEKGWPTKPLLSMGFCKNGMNFHYDDSGVELNCLGVGDFKDYSIIADTATLPTVSLNEMPSPEYLLQDDDIVFVRSNGNKKMVGRSVAVYPGSVPTTFSGFCIRFRRNDDLVITPYLLRVLKAESMRQKMYGRGANIQNLNQHTLSSLYIPVPPKTMQEEFATFVAQVDKSKAVVQKSLDKMQLLFDSLMQQYFG